MDYTEFTIFELNAVLQFLKDYINETNLSNYEERFIKHLFLGYLKLEKQKEEWEKAILYTE